MRASLSTVLLVVLFAPLANAGVGPVEAPGCFVADVATCRLSLMADVRPVSCDADACLVDVHATGRGMDKAGTRASYVTLDAGPDATVCEAWGNKEGAFCQGIQRVAWPLAEGCASGIVRVTYERLASRPEAGAGTLAFDVTVCGSAVSITPPA